MVHLQVLYHGSCFDGCASAALFASFYRQHVDPSAEVAFTPLVHGPPGALPDALLGGDDNAIVDFGYSRSDRLGWWFDHHKSGLKQPDREHFAGRPAGRFFYDPQAPSCAGWLSRSLAATRGFDTAPHAELIRWAEIIDAAAFPDARMAVELSEPALRIMTVLEASGDDPGLQRRIIAGMAAPGAAALVDVAADPAVDGALQPLLRRHRETIELVRGRVQMTGEVLAYDVADHNLEGINKFIPYFLRPEALYVVAVSASEKRAKISVGSNPWRPAERRHDIAALCQRHGGGGHPVVGAISLPPDQVDEARRIAAELVAELSR